MSTPKSEINYSGPAEEWLLLKGILLVANGVEHRWPLCFLILKKPPTQLSLSLNLGMIKLHPFLSCNEFVLDSSKTGIDSLKQLDSIIEWLIPLIWGWFKKHERRNKRRGFSRRYSKKKIMMILLLPIYCVQNRPTLKEQGIHSSIKLRQTIPWR